MKLSFFYQVDLAETWGKLKKALEQLAPTDPSLLQLLGRVLLYHISVGIQHKGALTDAQKTEELQSFLQNTADLNLGKGAEEILRDARQGILFREEAALSETDCGTFWTELLSLQPAEDYYHRNCPDGLEELFFELSSAYAYFGGKKDEELGEAQDYQFALQKAYDTLWQNKVLLHPDAERAKRLLAEGKFRKTRIFAARSYWSNIRRRPRMRLPRRSRIFRGSIFWTMCSHATRQRASRCGGAFWTSQSRP